MKLMVINGANINMVGIREKNIYGDRDFASLIDLIRQYAAEKGVEVLCLQSNHEGDLVDWIQKAYYDSYDGIIINPGAYTHTSLAIADAIKAIAPLPVIEVHLSDISQREEFRHRSFSAPYCLKQIKGLGFQGYLKAMDELIAYCQKKSVETEEGE